MNGWKKLPLWLWMLTKRLYKKPAFLVLLALIPLLTIGYQASVKDAGSVVTVGLVQQGDDALTQRIFQDLTEESRLIRYQVFSSRADAQSQLEAGKLEAVWIFPEDLQGKIQEFTETNTPFITVLERTDNVLLAFSRERLSSTLYRDVARTVYLNYIRQEVPELEHLSDEELMAYYDGTAFSDDLFTFGDGEKSAAEENFLLTPLRGLLAVVMALCGIAAAMHYQQDEEKGTFSWVDPMWRILPEISCQLVAVVQLGILSWICLAVCGLSRGFFPELATFGLYFMCVAAFAMLLRQVFGSVKWMAVTLPALCVIMLVVCPVFFDLGKLRMLQYLLPPTYCINAVYDPAYLGYMAIYTTLCFLFRRVAAKLRNA